MSGSRNHPGRLPHLLICLCAYVPWVKHEQPAVHLSHAGACSVTWNFETGLLQSLHITSANEPECSRFELPQVVLHHLPTMLPLLSSCSCSMRFYTMITYSGLPWSHYLWSLHVLHVLAWISPGAPGFLPWPKDVQIKSTR